MEVAVQLGKRYLVGFVLKKKGKTINKIYYKSINNALQTVLV
jgi:hypothetical protein